MLKINYIHVLTLCVILSMATTASAARKHILIMGSSTIFPFTASVIQSVSSKGIKVVNKSTGSGGGINAFCSGPGDEWPDITAASRRMSELERQRCQENGVDAITEIPIGHDGIVIANSIKAEQVNLTLSQLYLALAKEIPVSGSLSPNPHFSWNEIDTSLPSTKIEVMGPPKTSGTRDMFEQLAIKKGCESEPIVAKMGTGEQKMFCTVLRQDGHFMEMGEDDLEIIKKLKIFENSFGIFGYSYVLNHSDIVQPNAIEGILPNNDTIESGEYPLSRKLYLYVKNNRISSTPGLSEFLKEYISNKAIGDEGYLQDVGLVPLGHDEQSAAKAALMEILSP